MAVDTISMLTSFYKGIEDNSQKQTSTASDSVSFGDIINKQLNQLNDLQVEADDSSQKLATGEASNVHDVMIKAEEAKLALELAVQVRNKLVESYQEVMKLQV